MFKSGIHNARERAQRGPGGDWIGSVSGDQHRRLVAAANRTLEIDRDFDTEQHLAGGKQLIELGLAVR